MTIRPNITVTRHSRKIHPVPRKRQFAAGKLLGFVTILLFGRRMGEPKAGLFATAMVAASFVVNLPDLGGQKRLEEMGLEVHFLCEFEGD